VNTIEPSICGGDAALQQITKADYFDQLLTSGQRILTSRHIAGGFHWENLM